MRVRPGNRLEKLAGDRAGRYSIRINDQWRVCFRWEDGDAHEGTLTLEPSADLPAIPSELIVKLRCTKEPSAFILFLALNNHFFISPP